MPKELLGRFLTVGDGGTLVPLDGLIAAHLGSLFPGMEVVGHSLFRVTRDTDYDVSDEADDLMQAVEEELRRRRFGEVVRLEVEAGDELARCASSWSRRWGSRTTRSTRSTACSTSPTSGTSSAFPGTRSCVTRRSRRSPRRG